MMGYFRFFWISILISLFSGVFIQPAGRAADETSIQIIARVVDANTVILKGGRKIRLIGVNAPDPYDAEINSKFQSARNLGEKRMFELGREAKQFVQYLVQGQRVKLELEPQFAAFGHRDREGNILAYVWFTSPVFPETPDWLVMDPNIANARHDAFLNAIIVRAGYAEMDRRWPFSYAERFLALEQEAKENKRFIWNPDGRAQEVPNAA